VEIGAVELLNHVPTGRTFHVYVNPDRDMPSEAEAVHGLSAAFLQDKPAFAVIADELLAFLGDSIIVIHNAAFDMGFLNAELARLGMAALAGERVIDTLHLARQKHPMGPNSLDALCKRYGIDLTRRTKHGALLDSELLADVYIELIGGRQTALSLPSVSTQRVIGMGGATRVMTRPRPLPERISEVEREAHARLVSELGDGVLWKSFEI
jgi:DNA polymerase-3 subunit epsilon